MGILQDVFSVGLPAAAGYAIGGAFGAPWIGAALGGSVGTSILGSQKQSDALESAQKQQQQMYNDYTKSLADIFSLENRFTPEQLAAQKSIPALYQGQLWAAMGANPELKDNLNIYSDRMKYLDQEITNALNGLAANKNPEVRKTFQNSLDKLYAERDQLMNEYVSPFNEGVNLYNTLAAAQEQSLKQQAGAQLSSLEQQKADAMSKLMDAQRTQFGPGMSGSMLSQMANIENRAMPLKTAIQATPEAGMLDWRAGQAQQGLQNLINYAANPMGNQPYNLPAPPTMMPDYSTANLYNDIGSLMSLFAFSNMMNKNSGTTT